MKYKHPSINLFLPILEKWVLLFASKNHSNFNVKTLIGGSWVGKFFLLLSTCIHSNSFLLSFIHLVYCAHFEPLLRKKKMKTDRKKSMEVFIVLTCHLKFRIFFYYDRPLEKLKDLGKENVT